MSNDDVFRYVTGEAAWTWQLRHQGFPGRSRAETTQHTRHLSDERTALQGHHRRRGEFTTEDSRFSAMDSRSSGHFVASDHSIHLLIYYVFKLGQYENNCLSTVESAYNGSVGTEHFKS